MGALVTFRALPLVKGPCKHVKFRFSKVPRVPFVLYWGFEEENGRSPMNNLRRVSLEEFRPPTRAKDDDVRPRKVCRLLNARTNGQGVHYLRPRQGYRGGSWWCLFFRSVRVSCLFRFYVTSNGTIRTFYAWSFTRSAAVEA